MTCDTAHDVVRMRKGNEEPTGLAWYKNDGTLRDFTTGGPYTWVINVAKDSDDPFVVTFGNAIVATQLAVPNVTLFWPNGAFDTLVIGVPYVVQVDVTSAVIGNLGFKEFILLLDPKIT